jgi:hypothetical protein
LTCFGELVISSTAAVFKLSKILRSFDFYDETALVETERVFSAMSVLKWNEDEWLFYGVLSFSYWLGVKRLLYLLY